MCTSIRPLNYLKMSALFYMIYRWRSLMMKWWDRWVHYLVFNYSWLTTSLYFVVFSTWIWYRLSIDWQNSSSCRAYYIILLSYGCYIIIMIWTEAHMSLNPFINSKLGKWSSGKLYRTAGFNEKGIDGRKRNVYGIIIK